METGFQNDSLAVRTSDGEDDVLLEPLIFISQFGVCYRAPTGSTTDGLSTPKVVRIIPGYDSTGDDWWSGVLHDAGYRGTLEKESPHGDFVRADLTRPQVDELMLDAMTSQKVNPVRRHIIFWAVRLFGAKAWRKGHSKPL